MTCTLQEFKKLKIRRKYRYIIYRIEAETVRAIAGFREAVRVRLTKHGLGGVHR